MALYLTFQNDNDTRCVFRQFGKPFRKYLKRHFKTKLTKILNGFIDVDAKLEKLLTLCWWQVWTFKLLTSHISWHNLASGKISQRYHQDLKPVTIIHILVYLDKFHFGRLKIYRVCNEIWHPSKYGTYLSFCYIFYVSKMVSFRQKEEKRCLHAHWSEFLARGGCHISLQTR